MSAAGVGVRDMPSAQKDETLQQIHRNLLYIGQHLNDPQFVFAAAGKETVAGVSAEIVDVSSPDVSIRWFVDPSNGHVIREDYEAVGRSGPFHGETDLSDWKTTDGITLPVMHTNKENGKQTSTAESTKIEFNPQIDPKLFEKPPVQNAASPSQ